MNVQQSDFGGMFTVHRLHARLPDYLARTPARWPTSAQNFQCHVTGSDVTCWIAGRWRLPAAAAVIVVL